MLNIEHYESIINPMNYENIYASISIKGLPLFTYPAALYDFIACPLFMRNKKGINYG